MPFGGGPNSIWWGTKWFGPGGDGIRGRRGQYLQAAGRAAAYEARAGGGRASGGRLAPGNKNPRAADPGGVGGAGGEARR